MERKGFIFFASCLMGLAFNAYGAYMINFPQKIVQPNGAVIQCFLTGDEFYNRLHDENNYTIIQDQKSGCYCYAVSQNGELVASKYVVGVDNPKLSGLKPGLQISQEEILKIRNQSEPDIPDEPEAETKSAQINTVRTLNNLVIYIRFSDQPEFGSKQAIYSGYFNSADSGANSMYNYFREVSYQKLNIVSTFYPKNDGAQIKSYQDSHTRNYYCPQTAQNDSGYSLTDGGTMRNEREWNLVSKAIRSIKNQVPSTLDLDTDRNRKVDNVCFIIRDDSLNSNVHCSLMLCPHTFKLYYSKDSLNSKLVYCYNIHPECYLDHLQAGALCHEMFHSLGAGDLYRSSGKSTPVGKWDLMGTTANPPQSMCAAYKYHYGHWIDAIPEITTSGHYTLNPLSSASNNCFKIEFSKPEYFVLEFRQKSGTFESSLPGTGLIIYRINKSADYNNFKGPPDWIYIFRPGGTNSCDGNINEACFDESVGRSAFNRESSPSCCLRDGSPGNVSIENIRVNGNTVSFDVRFYEIIYSKTNQLPLFTDAINRIETQDTVVVKKTDRIVFNAGQEILLKPGFKVEPGGQFETNMNGNKKH